MRRGWIAVVAALTSCAWVQLSQEGEAVHVGTAAEVVACQKLGATNANTRNRAGIFARSGKRVEEELANLARNEAVSLGGDTVVPRGPVTAEGRRTYDVYRCR